jgi:hypothetical protein
MTVAGSERWRGRAKLVDCAGLRTTVTCSDRRCWAPNGGRRWEENGQMERGRENLGGRSEEKCENDNNVQVLFSKFEIFFFFFLKKKKKKLKSGVALST